jgi:hypothetical protein
MAEGTDVSGVLSSADQATAGLRRRIESERLALDASLDRLSGRVHETLDWRRQAARHRGALLAAGGGLLLAGAWRWRRRRRDPMDRLQATVSRAAEAFTRQAGETFEAVRRGVAPPRPGWLQRVLVPLALAVAREALSRRMDRNVRAEAARPTPADAREQGDSAVWNEEEQEWNRKSSSTIGA